MGNLYVCYNCQSENSLKIGVLPDFDNDIFKCNDCGLIQSDLVTDPYLKNYYMKKYRNIRNETITEDYISFMKQRALSQKEFIKSYCTVPPDSKIIDIGAAVGELLLSFQDECKELYATECDIKMKLHLDKIEKIQLLSNPDMFNKNYIRYFNFVFMSHVFEHLNDPLEYLDEVHKIISDDGYLFIEVPNEPIEVVNRHVKNRKKGSGHLFFYDVESIKKLLTTTDLFKIVKIETFGISFKDLLQGKSIAESFEQSPNGIYIRCLMKKQNGRLTRNYRAKYYMSNCIRKDLKIQFYQENIEKLSRLLRQMKNENLSLRESYSFKIGHLILSPIKFLKRIIKRL